MFKLDFYHASIRKYTVLFGTLFNDINISRKSNTEQDQQTFRIPISYGPREKFLARVEEDADLTRGFSISLPRMGFEITDISYDGSRKLSTTHSYVNKNAPGTFNAYTKVYVPVPYNIRFRLSVLVKEAEDATKIVEQILPFFTPDFTVSVKLLDDMPNYVLDIPIVMNSISVEDNYDQSFKVRRSLVWNLDFTMKGYLFGATMPSKIIKIAHTNTYTDFSNTASGFSSTISPGLTVDGNPTSNVAESIPLYQINEDDNYGFIVEIEDYQNGRG